MTYKSTHAQVFKRRKEWFEMPAEAHMALWWIEAGTQPTTVEGDAPIGHLRRHGPGSCAFTLKARFPAPEPLPIAVEA